MKLLVSIVLEDFRSLWLSIARAGRPPDGRLGSRTVPPEPVIARQGGRLLSVEWDPPKIVSEIRLPTPSGFAQIGEALWVGSAWSDAISVIEHGDVREQSHPLLNDVHNLQHDTQGLLVACAGSDAVVDLHTGWSWHARGETTDVLGQPLVRHDDYRGQRIPTLHRALHLNAAIRHQNRVLATSLHRGSVLSLEEDRVVPLMEGLAAPHGLCPDGAGLLLCDSRRGQVLELDADLQVIARQGAMRWAQDATRAPDGRLFALDVPDLGRPDREPARVVEVMSGEALPLPDGWRPHTIRVQHA